jgi:hypothetical protein
MFSNQNYTKSLGSLISTKLRSLLQDRLTVLSKYNQPCSDVEYKQELDKTNHILYKIGCLYINRMKLPDNESIADLMFQLYQNYAK